MMTRKQLESIIRFSSVFNDASVDIASVNEQYGLELTEATSPSQAVTAYLEAKGIELEVESDNRIHLHLYGNLVMTLNSKQEWINRVPNQLPPTTRRGEHFLWIDANGCKFESGADFEAAEKLGSYPCRIYKLMSVAEYEEGGSSNGN